MTGDYKSDGGNAGAPDWEAVAHDVICQAGTWEWRVGRALREAYSRGLADAAAKVRTAAGELGQHQAIGAGSLEDLACAIEDVP